MLGKSYGFLIINKVLLGFDVRYIGNNYHNDASAVQFSRSSTETRETVNGFVKIFKFLLIYDMKLVSDNQARWRFGHCINLSSSRSAPKSSSAISLTGTRK